MLAACQHTTYVQSLCRAAGVVQYEPDVVQYEVGGVT